jgi:hypothetical protein
MAKVACFCGCLFSFDGAGAACPRCGEYAAIMTAGASAGKDLVGTEFPALDGVRADEAAWVLSLSASGLVAGR